MKFRLILALAMALPLASQTSGSANSDKLATAGRASARADLKDAKGNSVGSVVLVETQRGTLMRVDTHGLPAGEHGFHIHEVGKCDAPDFKSAGGHYNPARKEHGFYDTNGQHAGDLANLVVDQSGNAASERYLEDVTLNGGKAPLLDQNGSAIVVHARRDDYQTDPAGQAGDRIACGVVVRQ